MRFSFSSSKFSPAFYAAVPIVLILVFLAVLIPGKFSAVTAAVRGFIGIKFGWFYLLSVLLMVLVSFFFIVSPVGKIRLGNPGSKPEYSTFAWSAMLFSAGMGIGLIFYGAAEPLSHYAVRAPEAALYSPKALSDALKRSFYHYGVHAWAIYAIIGLALAYFQFRKKEKTLISSTLKPLFGRLMDGYLGAAFDSLTIIATVAGVATSLGFGAAQINGGFHYLWGVESNFRIQLIIILVATALFLLSAISGIGRGVKILSQANVLFAVVLLLGSLFIGSGVNVMNNFVESIGSYFSDFLKLSTWTAANGAIEQQEWVQSWTVLYWAWWISWSPFVGVFIARISKGRTIREFLLGVIFIPTIFTFLWFSVFGVLAAEAVDLNLSIAKLPLEQMLFGTFAEYRGGFLLSILAVVLIFSFFITSADSATYVLAMQSEKGDLYPDSRTKLVWGLCVSGIASALLYAGGLTALQNVMIILALPFTIILLLLMVSLIKELTYEQKKMGLLIMPKRYPEKNKPFRSYEAKKEET